MNNDIQITKTLKKNQYSVFLEISIIHIKQWNFTGLILKEDVRTLNRKKKKPLSKSNPKAAKFGTSVLIQTHKHKKIREFQMTENLAHIGS